MRSSRVALRDSVDSFIDRYAPTKNLDPELVKAVLYAGEKSNLDPRAVSPKDARGLMQITEGAVIDTGRDPATFDYFSPSQNLMAGMDYLALQLEAFEGNVPRAVAAYNAGPTAVRQAKTLNDLPRKPEPVRDYVSRTIADYERRRRKPVLTDVTGPGAVVAGPSVIKEIGSAAWSGVKAPIKVAGKIAEAVGPALVDPWGAIADVGEAGLEAAQERPVETTVAAATMFIRPSAAAGSFAKRMVTRAIAAGKIGSLTAGARIGEKIKDDVAAALKGEPPDGVSWDEYRASLEQAGRLGAQAAVMSFVLPGLTRREPSPASATGMVRPSGMKSITRMHQDVARQAEEVAKRHIPEVAKRAVTVAYRRAGRIIRAGMAKSRVPMLDVTNVNEAIDVANKLYTKEAAIRGTTHVPFGHVGVGVPVSATPRPLGSVKSTGDIRYYATWEDLHAALRGINEAMRKQAAEGTNLAMGQAKRSAKLINRAVLRSLPDKASKVAYREAASLARHQREREDAIAFIFGSKHIQSVDAASNTYSFNTKAMYKKLVGAETKKRLQRQLGPDYDTVLLLTKAIDQIQRKLPDSSVWRSIWQGKMGGAIAASMGAGGGYLVGGGEPGTAAAASAAGVTVMMFSRFMYPDVARTLYRLSGAAPKTKRFYRLLGLLELQLQAHEELEGPTGPMPMGPPGPRRQAPPSLPKSQTVPVPR